MGVNTRIQTPIGTLLRNGKIIGTVEHLGNSDTPNLLPTRPSVLLTTRHRASRDDHTRGNLACAQHMSRRAFSCCENGGARALDPVPAAGLSPAASDGGEEPLPVAAAGDAPACDSIGGEPEGPTVPKAGGPGVVASSSPPPLVRLAFTERCVSGYRFRIGTPIYRFRTDISVL